MHLIDNGTQVTSLPAPNAAVGTPGYGYNGEPGTGTPTVWDADIANSIVAEIANAVTASGQTLDRTNNAQLATAIGTGRWLATQIFTTSGTYTPTPGMKKCRVRAVGPGGPGSGCAATAGNVSLGSAGTGGTYAEAIFTAAQIGASSAVVIGAGVAGGVGGAVSAGSSTTLGGTLLVCPAGVAGGVLANQTAPTQSGTGSFSANASVSAGTLLYNKVGMVPGLSVAQSTSQGWGSAGGDTPFGSGGYGTNFNANGANASGYGAGGSGTAGNNSGGTMTGGASFAGFMVIDDFG